MTEMKHCRPAKRTVKRRRALHLPLCFPLRPTPRFKKKKKKPLWALCSEIIIKTKPATCVTDVCRTVLKPSKQPVQQAVVSPAATRDSEVHYNRAMRLELKENHRVIQFKMRQFSVFICLL